MSPSCSNFGLVVSRKEGVDNTRITQAGMILGTPAYMSPEQCAGEDQPGESSDIYSFGAVAYFLLTGKAPFEGRGPMQVIAAHLYEMPVSPRVGREEIPAELDALVMRCLAKGPGERYASVSALHDELMVLGTEMRWRESDARGWWMNHGAS